MVKVADLSREIAKQVATYSAGLESEIKAAEIKVAKEAVSELKSKSPRNEGSYATGWAVKKTDRGIVIYNRTDYQLTHLLEYGHAKANGGRVSPRAHIRPVEEKAIADFTDLVEKAART